MVDMDRKAFRCELEETSKLMYQNVEKAAYERCRIIIGKLQKLSEELIEHLHIMDTKEAAEMERKIMDTLKRLIDCFMVNDILGLADCLYYEVPIIIEMHSTLIEGI